MALLIQVLVEQPLLVLLVIPVTALVVYIVYQLCFHPLANYPGPVLASLTDLWQVYQFLTLKQPYRLAELHERYGPVVRYGPDKISITHAEAIPLLYQKGGKMFPKTEYYDAFGAIEPNVFGMRDEALHSVRRRHMSHSFSMAYVKQLEKYMDLHIKLLTDRITEYCVSKEQFDLKRLLKLYVVDVLGELAFSQSFGLQEADDETCAPPVIEHSLLAAVTGAWPSMTSKLKKWLPIVPWKPLQDLFKGRSACAALAAQCVARRLDEIGEARMEQKLAPDQRTDLLTSLIMARDPESGEQLGQAQLQTEAFGFIIAGTHTTVATTTLLFHHLLHNPDLLKRCVKEIDAGLPTLASDQAAYPVATVETQLPFLRDCVKENYRHTPIFTMPLARRVIDPSGVMIGGCHFPQGTSLAVSSHAFHHNASVWGADHNIFDPNRWQDESMNERSKLLMHFGLGPRQCLGKTIASANIYKLMGTLLKKFEFGLADKGALVAAEAGGFRGVLPNMVSVGISDLNGGLMVTARRRL